MIGTGLKNSSSDKKLKACLKQILGFSPGNIDLYKLALRHSSVAKEIKNGLKDSNERLEFLGDAILDAAISHYLFQKYPFKNEGFLTKFRSKLVSRSMLNELAVKTGIDDLIEKAPDMASRTSSINGNAFEALIGAIYLDKGYERTVKFLQTVIIKHYLNIEALEDMEYDYKSRLIEWGQKYRKNVLFETQLKPESSKSLYTSHAVVDGVESGSGEGTSKKKAEQVAAFKAWEVCCQPPVKQNEGNQAPETLP